MKHTIGATVLLVLMMTVVGSLSCQTSPEEEAKRQLDSLVDRWSGALVEEEIEGIVSCYWDNAVSMNYWPGEESEMEQGSAEIRASAVKGFEELDYGSMGFIWDETVRFFPEGGNPVYIRPVSSHGFMDVFEFEERGDEYRIIRHYVLPHP